MKKLLLTMGAVLFLISGYAQAPSFQWAKGLGGLSDDYANSMAVDASGNTYITGSFKGTVDFDPGPGTSELTSKGGSDIYILKLDASGNFAWVQQIGGSMDDEGYAILADASGSLYLSGTFEGTADFDPGTGVANFISAGGTDAFIAKLDASGNLSWNQAIGGTGDDAAMALGADHSSNIYVAGNFANTVDFDPGSGVDNMTSAGLSDMFVLKLDASGDYMWAKRTGGALEDRISAIAVDASGNINATGTFDGTVDFDPNSGTVNLSSNGLSDVFITKLDASGNLLWANRIGGLLEDEGADLTVDASGNVYITGSFNGVVDFDPASGSVNLTAFGGSDAFVLKLNSSGNFVWARNMGGLLFDRANSIAVDASGNVYSTGVFQGLGDFDPGSGTLNLSAIGMSDAFISRLDVSGNLVWARSMGSTTDDYGNDVVVNPSGDVYTAGSFSGTADFDPGSSVYNVNAPGGGSDIYTQRLTQSGTFIAEESLMKEQPPYPNPGAGLYNYILSAKANVEVYNANGQLIYRQVGDKGLNKIDISSQPAGMYFFILSSVKEGIVENHTLVKY